MGEVGHPAEEVSLRFVCAVCVSVVCVSVGCVCCLCVYCAVNQMLACCDCASFVWLLLRVFVCVLCRAQ